MMQTRIIATAIVLILSAVTSRADTSSPARFRWQKGDVQSYQVEQVTNATSVVRVADTEEFTTIPIVTKLNLVKQWTVLDVDAAGVATLQLMLTQLRFESRTHDALMNVFDSTKADPNSVEGKSMMEHVNKPIRVVRIDTLGKLVEVKENKYGSASQIEADLPFRIVLPEMAWAIGTTWERGYVIKMDPPQGTGETYEATQKYTLKELTGPLAVMTVSTTLKAPPLTGGELIPLCPLQPEGELSFDTATGRFERARLKVAKEVPNHQGVGTKYTYKMTYSEDRVETK